MHYRSKTSSGFTLIELLVVIAIIGFLATASMVAYTTVKMKGRNTKRHADTSTIQKALGLYQTRNEKFPINPGVCIISTDAVSVALVQDLPKMPVDPSAKATTPSPLPPGVPTAPHCYYYISDGSTYTLYYYIEGEGQKTRTP